jgi:hypothetical protein
MSWKLKHAATFAAALAQLSATSCLTGDADPYSRVAPACMERNSDMGTYYEEWPGGYLSKECTAALEAVLPYDEESFAHAPPGFRTTVNEAFQALIAYPLAIPKENTLFGTAPKQAGAIPLDFVEIFQAYGPGNLNQAIFNYILNRVEVIRYEEAGPSGHSAQLTPGASSDFFQLTIFHKFWSPSDDISDLVRDPFGRAALLAHEARHADGFVHMNCDPDKTDAKGWQCDSELGGAYGLQVTYLKYLLHGSATCQERHHGWGCRPLLAEQNVYSIGDKMCRILKRNIKNPYPELAAFLKDLECSGLKAEDVMALEGIPLPPQGLRTNADLHPDPVQLPDPEPSPLISPQPVPTFAP